MKGILNPDSPFSQFMTRVADLCIINILMIVCCLPIVTVGAAVAAAHKATQDIVYETGGSVLISYFKAFKSCFKQATVVWLVELFLSAVLLGYFLIISNRITGSTRTVLYLILACAALVLVAIVTYLYPLIARYENTLKRHLVNSFLLILLNLPRTLAMMAIALVPAIMLCFFTSYFIQFGIFFLLMGFSFILLVNNYLIKAIFDKLDQQQAEANAKAAAAMETADELQP